ncbi:hypothetical protein DICSQDRAFT_162011 [Dichomitus squalens LYAD-421 SS1]|uniref:ABC transporter domain-containing protein n=1 Tax=Dichomitus squalens (strain LYAD-421) TaxID=732165 RepID=R7SWD4_DICSQ|nr:uncharacterized protein DICSQDRAFT_162011 [Dichomitus squalens LYAD-421 SS1]EJF60391.1 hypothetical protein DICSQDRAFT_162011 [Dichomitus squalens LYAD-421 SS1]
MASASTTMTVTPREEKVAVVERRGQNTQYALKFAGAAFANMASSAICNPTDIIKVRQQLRTQAPGGRANAFWSVGVEMARKEGIRSLGGGMSASMLREVVYSGIRMGTYELFKDKLHDASRGALSKEGLPLKIMSASIAATIGSALANPADLVKGPSSPLLNTLRMQAYYPNGSPYRNMRHAFATIYQDGAQAAVATRISPGTGGLRALYRGVWPTTVRGIVLSATQICSYDQIKQSLKRRGIMQEGVPLHFVASTFAGFFCSVTSNPVDVVKVRLMNDKNHEFKGALDCVRQITAKEGLFGFYKGFGMCWARFSGREGIFDPNDTRRVRHTKIGVWDLYEEREPKLSRIPGSVKLERYLELLEGLPYVWRMIKDVINIPTCAFLLFIYALVELGQAIFPAAGLWYQGQLLDIMQVAIDTRTIDKDRLVQISAGRIACSLGLRLMLVIKFRIEEPLIARIRRYYGVRLFHARARLDVPTYETTSVQRQLDEVSSEAFGRTVAFETLQKAATFLRAGFQLTAQAFVLLQVLRGQRDGILLCALTLSSQGAQWVSAINAFQMARVWAATTTNEDYVRMEGWRRVIGDPSHRKEVVAGNLAEYASAEFKKASDQVGDRAADFREWLRRQPMRRHFGFWSILEDPLRQIPQFVFTLRAIQYPANMPVSLASLHLIQESTMSFISNMHDLLNSTSSVSDQLAAVRKLYEVDKIKNKIADGTVPFPEDASQIKYGISLEFRNVSFKFPGADKHALRNVSFALSPGQLCVIVGVNGSGKSTILKLIARLYDPVEGQILVGGHDIRTLRLHDLRQAISVLFQDFTHFPLSIRDNIAVGDPSAATDEDHIRLAARLGGVEEFIEKLPEGFDTYLDRPVRDYHAGLPEGTKTLFGRNVDYSAIRNAGGLKSSSTSALSGGQMQRLAVARTFMRSVVSEEAKVGLLLFDEPSASLDPLAEHDLFDRLRDLRGSKTMLFSSHRFGNLTRHADLILYMNDTVVIESGTHEELLKQGGEYAKIWNLQAQAFI